MLPIPLKSLRAQSGGSSFYSKKIWGFCQETWGKKGLPGDKPVVEEHSGPPAYSLDKGNRLSSGREAPSCSPAPAGQYRSLSLDSLTGTSYPRDFR